jgi:hypothetical protein
MMTLCLSVRIHLEVSGQGSEYGEIVNVTRVIQQTINRNLRMSLLLRRPPMTSSVKNILVEKIGEFMA